MFSIMRFIGDSVKEINPFGLTSAVRMPERTLAQSTTGSEPVRQVPPNAQGEGIKREALIMELDYIRRGDYYIPELKLPWEKRPIGKWGRLHRDSLKEYHPIQFNLPALSGNFHTDLADLNEQAQARLGRIFEQIKATEGVTKELKAADPMLWMQHNTKQDSSRSDTAAILFWNNAFKEAVCYLIYLKSRIPR